MKKQLLIVLILFPFLLHAQPFPAFKTNETQNEKRDELVRRYLSPVKVVWQSPTVGKNIENVERLLFPGNGQADLSGNPLTVLKSDEHSMPGILLDYGKELNGGVQLVTGNWPSGKPVKVRIRFGESVSEAMSSIDESGATNDHAMRDFIIEVPWLGNLKIGNTGFRFVRIDLVEENTTLYLKEARAIFEYRDIPYLGSFKSSDTLLNKIWETGAYTVHLNMQDYLWDGVKRDRLVWVGDLHPEVATINSVFGYNEVVPKSLDLARDITPVPQYMSGMITYSMWWIILHKDWYMHHGNLDYLKEQREYLLKLLTHFLSKIENNKENIHDGTRFLDWPSSENEKGIDAGIQAMLVWSLEAGGELSAILGEDDMAEQCRKAVANLRTYQPDPNHSKQAASLLSLTGIMPAKKANDEIIAVGGAKDFSTFYGYYMLLAKAKADDYQGAIDNIRQYWGGMLALGATSFWEDFNLEWMDNASRIDEIVPPDKVDIHAAYGDYCYVGHRHSLAHGWASGPTAWLTEYVLGVKVIAPGARKVRIVPHLGDLSFVEGTFPTPYGLIKIKHTKLASGEIESSISGPKEVEIIRE